MSCVETSDILSKSVKVKHKYKVPIYFNNDIYNIF